ncbi:MAG: hypothetical protein HY699_14035 [Deltaproteobacteria bacterium]|nr:hypothetical protein [Deltaproteobacteria bacterium]
MFNVVPVWLVNSAGVLLAASAACGEAAQWGAALALVVSALLVLALGERPRRWLMQQIRTAPRNRRQLVPSLR